MKRHVNVKAALLIALCVVIIFVCSSFVLSSRERSRRQSEDLLARELLQACRDWSCDSSYVWCVNAEDDGSLRRSTTNDGVFAEGLGVNHRQLDTTENSDTIAALLRSLEIKNTRRVESITPGEPKYSLCIDTDNGAIAVQFHGDLAVSYIATDSGYLLVEFTMDIDAFNAAVLI